MEKETINLITEFTNTVLPVDDNLFRIDSDLIREDIDKLAQSIVDMVIEKIESITPPKDYKGYGAWKVQMTLDDHKRNFSQDIINSLKQD